VRKRSCQGFFGWETQLPQDSVSVCSPASGIFSRRRWRSPGWRRRSAMSTRRARVVNGRSPSAAGAHGLATGRRSAFDLPRKGHLYSCRCRSTSAPRLLPPASGHLPRSCCLRRAPCRRRRSGNRARMVRTGHGQSHGQEDHNSWPLRHPGIVARYRDIFQVRP
jgi:hypothetical protein